MEISLITLLGSVLTLLSFANGYDDTSNYSYQFRTTVPQNTYYGFNHQKDPLQVQNQMFKQQWQKPMNWNKPSLKPRPKIQMWKQPWTSPAWKQQWSTQGWKQQRPVQEWDRAFLKMGKKPAYRLPSMTSMKPSTEHHPHDDIVWPIPLSRRVSVPEGDWPSYILPVRMIKLPLDEPPAAIN